MFSGKKFNVRVYGIVINDSNEILVAHEVRNGFEMTKLPGGGLEWGEGLIDGLKREFIEELNWEIEIESLFYLTDYFQVSSLDANDQVLSVYYKVKFVRERDSVHKPNAGEFIEFEWINLKSIDPKSFTFPIDRKVIQQLINLFRES